MRLIPHDTEEERRWFARVYWPEIKMLLLFLSFMGISFLLGMIVGIAF